MRYRQLPTSMPAARRVLDKCNAKCKNTSVPADRAISADTWAKLNDADPAGFYTNLIKKAAALGKAEAAQSQRTLALKTTADRLATYCADFHIVLDRGINRGAFAPGARAYYGRDVHAKSIPKTDSYDDLKSVALAIIQGETARAQAEGGPPATFDSGLRMDSGVRFDSTGGTYRAMDLPSAVEVNAVYQEFEAARLAVEAGAVELNAAQETLAADFPAARALAVDIYDEVEFFYRRDPDPASRRAKCEPWGLQYVSEGEEEPTPEPPEPTPEPNPPGV